MKNSKVLFLLLAPILVLVPTAQAALPTATSGTFTTTVTSIVPVLTADGNSAFSLAGTIVITGTFVGSGPIVFIVFVRATGADNFLGNFTCACTVAGESGNLRIGFTAT